MRKYDRLDRSTSWADIDNSITYIANASFNFVPKFPFPAKRICILNSSKFPEAKCQK